MASNPKSLLRKIMPTAHRSILEEKIKIRLKSVTGKVLVIGAGYDPYRDFLPNATSITITDIDDNLAAIDEIADAHNLTYSNDYYDAIIAIEVFEHLHTPAKAMAECYRVLSKNGIFICSIPFMFHIHGDPSDYQRITKEGIKRLAKSFDDICIEELGGRLAVISDIVTTSNKFLIPLRIFNHFFKLPYIKNFKSKNCPSGYWIEAKK
tara:strand:+ start:5976 stop:6599 length:624 start_codon:yes stop_codon:yes gene_type:complete